MGLVALWAGLCILGLVIYGAAQATRILRWLTVGVSATIRREADPWGSERRRDDRRQRALQRALDLQQRERRLAILRLRRERPAGSYRGWWADKLREHEWACVYCGVVSGKPGGPDHLRLHKEHDVPLARGGRHAVWNIVPACADCNFRKGVLTGDEFRARMADPAYARRRLTAESGARQQRVEELDRLVLRAIESSRRDSPASDSTRADIQAWIRRRRAAGTTTAEPSYSDLTSSLTRLTRAGRVERTGVGRYRTTVRPPER